jgi:site-specific DNA recombinase
METSDWQGDSNKNTMLIIRRSGYGQKENTSGDTQLRESQDYAKRHGLNVVHTDSIIETAFKRKERRKFRALIQKALKENIRHVLFFWSSREARNLTDIEENDELIRAGKVIIHHVSEGKVYWKKTPDSDFTYRELNAVINKSESRSKSTMLKAALRTKALSGWWPYRHTPLGYIHSKNRDRYGNAIKGTATIAIDPDAAVVRLVQREFELRAQGTSYDEIRSQNLAAPDLVPVDMRKTYSRHGIEDRLKNPFYWGYFYLKGDSTRYEGRHEKIIPEKILKAVALVNEGNGSKRKTSVSPEDDVFRGWLYCGHPECARLVTYEKKRKLVKSTGETKIYHLYRCSNSRRIHTKHVYLSEQKIWEQFEPILEKVSITPAFAKDIQGALNEAHEQQKGMIQAQLEECRKYLKALEEKEDSTYDDLKRKLLDESQYERRMRRIRDERDEYQEQFERLKLANSESGAQAVQKVFELAIDAKSLWKEMSRQERVEYLKKVCSNPKMDGLTVQYETQNPFARLSAWKGFCEWRRE